MSTAERILLWTGHICIALYAVALVAGALRGSVGLVLTGALLATTGMSIYGVAIWRVYGGRP